MLQIACCLVYHWPRKIETEINTLMKKDQFRRVIAPFILPLFIILLLGSGCASSGQTLASAEIVMASEEGILPAATASPAAAPTLPSVSVFILTEGESGYPAGNEAVPALDESGEPIRPTAQPTDPPPTGIPTATPIPEATATPQPTFTPPALPQTSNDDHFWFRRPVPDGTAVWTDKVYPYGGTRGGQLRTHHGVEFNVTYDTPILAVADGTVVVAGPDSSEMYGPQLNFYGNLVVIEHDFAHNGQPLFSLYGHLNSIDVVVGQQVRALDRIGLSGATGVADGPHLHFEVRVGQNNYQSTRNPILWLWPFPDRGALAGRVVFSNGETAKNAQVSIRRIDGGDPAVFSVGTYNDDMVNGDDVWDENFAFDDVPAGYYEVFVKVDGRKYAEEVWVFSRRTSFVELVLK